jgi:cell division protein FtsI (penicillin-binding protein 3)
VTPPRRSDGPPPRRRTDPEDTTVVPFRRSKLGEARAYTPRGSTIREAAQRRQARDAAVPAPRSDSGTRAARTRAGEPAARRDAEPRRAAEPRRTAEPRKAADSRKAADPRKAAEPRRTAEPRKAAEPRRTAEPRRRAAEPRRTAEPRRRAGEAKKAGTRATPRKPAATATRRGTTTTSRATGTRTGGTAGTPRRAPAPPRKTRVAKGTRPPRRPRRIRVPRLGNPARRLRFATAVVLLLFGVLAGRLVQIQASDGAAYAAAAAAGRMTQPITLVAPRGAILDRNGNPLARSVDAVEVDADPKHVDDPVKTAKALAGLLGVAESELVAKMSRKTNAAGEPIRFEYLARRLDPEIGQAVKALDLAGINVRKEQRRDVPGHDLAANVVGFTGWDGGGLAGIEASYDDVLRGTDGSRQYEIGRHGQEIPDGYSTETPAKPGRDVQLTLDRDLQFEALKVLAARVKAAGATNGTAVVLDVKTGEILAMASYPTYDAAKPDSSTEKTRMDLATGSVVEPGSVHKVITLGAGLQEGKIKPDSVLTIGPTVQKGGRTFRDTHPHGTVDITLMGVLAQSSNVATIQVADRIGADKLYEYQRKFGLGTKTGSGLPGESAGLVQPPDRWSGPSYGTIPIGLGVAVTPLQMTSVYATIANDGLRVTPTLVAGTRNADGTLVPKPRSAPVRVLSPQNARALRTDLEAVPTKYGTGKKAAVPGYRVAGKTGTGKRTQDSRYLPGDVSSFIGMVPADAPRYVVGIFAHGPGGSGS